MNRLLWVSLSLSLLMTAGCGFIPVQNTSGQTQTPVQNPPSQTQIPTQNSTGQKLGPGPAPIPEPIAASRQESQAVAGLFLRNSPTFKFDGIEGTLNMAVSEAGATPKTWVFHYEFQSRQAGYGDRTGLFLAQVITDHKARIVVEQGAVVSAVLDDRWDELNQKIIK